ncbi:hypothetical protein EYF80_047264 [Liparis tanakae]|uniref:Uncharacterized protein n=1 Tax=Liparis tanakae TaxID=230148 RepID=A0A4Z2FN33_9TELE|nr:hypothetical protein EYF80_047264 [Liparis tanakae]
MTPRLPEEEWKSKERPAFSKREVPGGQEVVSPPVGLTASSPPPAATLLIYLSPACVQPSRFLDSARDRLKVQKHSKQQKKKKRNKQLEPHVVGTPQRLKRHIEERNKRGRQEDKKEGRNGARRTTISTICSGNKRNVKINLNSSLEALRHVNENILEGIQSYRPKTQSGALRVQSLCRSTEGSYHVLEGRHERRRAGFGPREAERFGLKGAPLSPLSDCTTELHHGETPGPEFPRLKHQWKTCRLTGGKTHTHTHTEVDVLSVVLTPQRRDACFAVFPWRVNVQRDGARDETSNATLMLTRRGGTTTWPVSIAPSRRLSTSSFALMVTVSPACGQNPSSSHRLRSVLPPLLFLLLLHLQLRVNHLQSDGRGFAVAGDLRRLGGGGARRALRQGFDVQLRLSVNQLLLLRLALGPQLRDGEPEDLEVRLRMVRRNLLEGGVRHQLVGRVGDGGEGGAGRQEEMLGWVAGGGEGVNVSWEDGKRVTTSRPPPRPAASTSSRPAESRLNLRTKPNAQRHAADALTSVAWSRGAAAASWTFHLQTLSGVLCCSRSRSRAASRSAEQHKHVTMGIHPSPLHFRLNRMILIAGVRLTARVKDVVHVKVTGGLRPPGVSLATKGLNIIRFWVTELPQVMDSGLRTKSSDTTQPPETNSSLQLLFLTSSRVSTPTNATDARRFRDTRLGI